MTQEIKGYRNLTPREIDTINDIKRLGEVIESQVNAVASEEGTDARWTSIARTNLQQGLMALTRAVARPTNF